MDTMNIQPMPRRSFLKGMSIAITLWHLRAMLPLRASAAEVSGRAARSEKLYWSYWGWEPLDTFRRQGGIVGAVDSHAPWLEQWYGRLHSEELVEKMAALGVNLAITHFFKGFGLKHERAEQQRTAALVRVAHQQGIRVLGYCQSGTLYYENFLAEQPDAQDWIARDEKGKLHLWGNLKYRWFPCVNSRPFREYMKRAIRVGLEEVKLDGFHFDNDYAKSCYCPRCQQAFRQWIARRVPDFERQLGVSSLDAVRPPPTGPVPKQIQDPLEQEWVRFRCQSLADYHRELAEHARKIRRDVILLGNPGYPRHYDEPYTRSVWIPWLGRNLDLVFAENHNFPAVEQGVVVSQIRAYKQAAAAGYRVVSTTWRRSPDGRLSLVANADQIGLQLAEAAACQGVPGLNWALRPGGSGDRMQIDRPEFHDGVKKYLGFLREHEDLNSGAQPVRDVAIWHSFASSAFDFRHVPRLLASEEVLIRAGFAWEVVLDDDPGRLDRFAALVLAGQTHLADAEVAAIRRFVEQGSRLLLVGDNGTCDERGRNRSSDPWAGLPMDRLARLPAEVTETEVETSHVANTGGHTRVALPKQWPALAAAVERILGDRMSVRLLEGDTVALSAYQRGQQQLVVHLVNYAAPEPRTGMRLRLGKAWSGPRQVRLLSPDGPEQTLDMKRAKAGAFVDLPPLPLYAVVVVQK